MNNKKLWYPAALALALSVAFGAAQASAIEQTGTPGSAAPLGTYGVDVSTKAGLKNLLPAGWNLYIYKSTPLPSTISWTVQDTWLTALDRFASNNSLAVRVDWSAKALYVSTPEVAQQERAKLAELEAPTKTPLPVYSAAPAAQPTPVNAKPAIAAVTAAPVAQAKPAAGPAEPAISRVSPELLARALARTAANAPAAAPVATPTVTAAPAPAVVAKSDAAPVAVGSAPISPAAEPASAGRMHVVGGPAAAPALSPLSPSGQPTLAPRQLVALTAPANPARQPSVLPAQQAAPAPVQMAAPTRPAPVMAPVASAPAPFLQPAAPVAAQPSPRRAPPAQPEAPAGQAYAHGNMEDIVRSSAAKHGYQVTWETISLPLTGPVTFLGVDPAEDMKLLQKSLGNRQSPIAVEVYRGSNLIRVTANNGSREPLAVYDSSYSGVLSYGTRPAAAAPRVSVMPAQTAPVVQASPVSAPAPVAQVDVTVRAPEAAPAPVATAPAELKLRIEKGESLSKALSAFLAAQKWELRWQVPSDMEADFPVDLSGTDVKQVLKSLLPKLGLDTDMYAPSRVVVIRPLDNTAE